MSDRFEVGDTVEFIREFHEADIRVVAGSRGKVFQAIPRKGRSDSCVITDIHFANEGGLSKHAVIVDGPYLKVIMRNALEIYEPPTDGSELKTGDTVEFVRETKFTGLVIPVGARGVLLEPESLFKDAVVGSVVLPNTYRTCMGNLKRVEKPASELDTSPKFEAEAATYDLSESIKYLESRIALLHSAELEIPITYSKQPAGPRILSLSRAVHILKTFKVPTRDDQ